MAKSKKQKLKDELDELKIEYPKNAKTKELEKILAENTEEVDDETTEEAPENVDEDKDEETEEGEGDDEIDEDEEDEDEEEDINEDERAIYRAMNLDGKTVKLFTPDKYPDTLHEVRKYCHRRRYSFEKVEVKKKKK